MAAASSSLASSSSARAIESRRRSSLMSVFSSPTGAVRRAASRPIPSKAEEPVAGQQRQADRRLDLVAPDERAVDRGGGVPCDQLLMRDRKPDGGAVMV